MKPAEWMRAFDAFWTIGNVVQNGLRALHTWPTRVKCYYCRCVLVTVPHWKLCGCEEVLKSYSAAQDRHYRNGFEAGREAAAKLCDIAEAASKVLREQALKGPSLGLQTATTAGMLVCKDLAEKIRDLKQ